MLDTTEALWAQAARGASTIDRLTNSRGELSVVVFLANPLAVKRH